MTDKLTIAGDVATDLACVNEQGSYVYEYSEKRHKKLVTEWAAKHGVKAVMVDPSGPGGGHPVYEFTGTRAQLEAFVIDFYEAGEAHSEDLEFYFEDATPAT
jgi:hypothetical protein